MAAYDDSFLSPCSSPVRHRVQRVDVGGEGRPSPRGPEDEHARASACPEPGHSHAAALAILAKRIETDVVQWHAAATSDTPSSLWQCFLQRQEHHAAGMVFMLLATVLLAIGAGTVRTYRTMVIVLAVLLAVLTVTNILHNSLRCYQRKKEVMAKITSLLDWLKRLEILQRDACQGLSVASSWIKLNIVVRDGHRVVLPTAALVPGDVIVLTSGQAVPCACTVISPQLYGARLGVGGTVPYFALPDDGESGPTPMYLKVEECIAVNALRRSLSQKTQPAPVLEQNRNAIAMTLWKFLLPTAFVITFFMQLIYWQHLANNHDDWSLALLVLPVGSVLPLLPIAVPLLWEAIVMYFTAKMLLPVQLMYQQRDQSKASDRRHRYHNWLQFWLQLCFGGAPEYLARSNRVLFNFGRITTLCCVDKIGVLSLPTATPSQVFFFGPGDADMDVGVEPSVGGADTLPPSPLPPPRVRVNASSTHALQNTPLSMGAGGDSSGLVTPSRSCRSMTQGSKEQMDRLFPRHGMRSRRASLPSDLSMLEVAQLRLPCPSTASSTADESIAVIPGVPHVLDVTFRVEDNTLDFDDVNWEVHHNSLKPLGLNVLLHHGFPITDQLQGTTSLAVLASSLTSTDVFGNECMCRLGYRIGFDPTTMQHYECKRRLVLSATREAPQLQPLQTSLYRSSSMMSSYQQSSMLHLVSVLVSAGGGLQLMTQGSGDLVLEASTDYFTGHDICPMLPAQKRAIQDFITRHASQAHCVAFGYRPLPKQACAWVKWKEEKTMAMHLTANQSLTVAHQDMDAVSAYSEDNGADNRSHSFVRSSTSLVLPSPQPGGFQRLLSEQIFMGMVALQYLPKDDVIKLVEDARSAGIRFVHFSSESETRCRVFSSLLGLETGWNCHISLKPRSETTTDTRSRSATLKDPERQRTCSSSRVIEEETIFGINVAGSSSNDDAQTGTHPVAQINVDEFAAFSPTGSSGAIALEANTSEKSVQAEPPDFNETARLPRGVDEIRPHLDNVDNVPLQVPLFTDCQPDAICEMITIMQEYGEAVCCMGNSLDFQNTTAFFKADVAVAVEPELPVAGCPVKSPPFPDEESMWLQLATRLCSVPCSLVCRRNDPVQLMSLIERARSSLHTIAQYFFFLTGCCVSMTLLFVVASLFFLPPPLSLVHIMWLLIVILPLTTSGILGAPADPYLKTMIPSRATKHQLPMRKLAMHFVLCFLPLASVVLLCHGVVLTSFCDYNASQPQPDNRTIDCHPLLGDRGFPDGPWHYPLRQVVLAQEITAFIFVVFCGLMSITFYHRTLPLTAYIRQINWKCILVLLAGIVLHVIYMVISILVWFPSSSEALALVRSINQAVWVLLVVWPLVMVVICELLKHREHRQQCKEQRRAKLIFETKLGMNSPI